MKKDPLAQCDELRRRIIEVMAVNGGHLSSNLGAIEITVALHHVFDSPTDRFIFDVSHQTYAHKILTNRNPQFPTIRKYKGLSGFASPDESPHDHFYAGHAGTALSLALGLAKARDLVKSDEYIIPVIGDAALTCGLTFEALNNVPPDLRHFILILNDNNMSISKNVGAITQILGREGKGEFFEQFGLSYQGPCNGHNVFELIDYLEEAKESNQPILLHALTTKGHGMDLAVQNPTIYHGVKPFDPKTGEFYKVSFETRLTFPQVVGKHLLEVAEKEEETIVLTPAMPAGSCLTELMKRFPERCLDVGIAEGHCVTFAGGLAKYHQRRVIVVIYATFLQRALDNLFHDVCLQGLPVLFCLDRGGLAGGDGSTHNGVYDIGFLISMPHLIVCQPRDGHLLKELIDSSAKWNRPTVIRYPNLPTEVAAMPLEHRSLGKGEVLAEGEDLVIIALGHHCETALKTRELLLESGISAAVVDPIFLKPLDKDLIERLCLRYKTLVMIEEHSIQSGLSSIIHHHLMQQGIDSVKTLCFAVPDRFIEHGDHKSLMAEIGLDHISIARQISEALSLQML